METHVASACILMQEFTIFCLTPLRCRNCLNHTGHLRTYKYTAAQSTTQCLQIRAQKGTAWFVTKLMHQQGSKHEWAPAPITPSPTSQRWSKVLKNTYWKKLKLWLMLCLVLDVGRLAPNADELNTCYVCYSLDSCVRKHAKVCGKKPQRGFVCQETR